MLVCLMVCLVLLVLIVCGDLIICSLLFDLEFVVLLRYGFG